MPTFSSLILTLWISLASSLPAVGGMRGLVLCFSSQSHVAFEAQHVASHCTGVCDESTSHGDTGVVGSDSSHHSCFDFTLGSIDIRTDRVRPPATHVENIISCAPVSVIALLRDFAKNDALPSSRLVAAPVKVRLAEQRALRSVILCI